MICPSFIFANNTEYLLIHVLFFPVSYRQNAQKTHSRVLTTVSFHPVLSVPETHSIETKSTTKAPTRKIPNVPVLAWNNFFTNAFYASTVLDTDNRIFSRPNVIGGLSVEESVVEMFLKMMEATNNQRLILLPTPECWSRRYMFWTVKGQPDVIRCAGDIQLLNSSVASQLLSVVEIKTEQLMRTLVDDGTELFNAYNLALIAEDDGTTAYTRHYEIIRIIRQLFGYMVVNDLKYGLLTTYIRTWFFYCKNDNSDNIYISLTVHINQSHTGNSASFLECMYYFENISTTNPTLHFIPPNTDDGDDNDDENDDNKDKNDKDRDKGDKYKDKDGKDRDKDSDKDDEYQASSSKKRTLGVITHNQSKKRKAELNDNEFLNNMKNYKRNQFSFGDVLGNGRFGIIFMAKLHEQEILNEIRMYLGPLKKIQGIYTPKLLKYGVLHEAFAFLLTSFAGKSFADIKNITEKEKQLAIDGLLAIHAKGVKHGDIRLENIVIERNELTDDSNVRWIDFA
ncbi:37501_t:CDS:2 [Gigaspora margarita]|uniref:37501_t:CDS:1 n=1 Tax=Gigaspora margarita TaxID=4874 RepID=A0ABN7UK26_GIGMA|nr:37501_t:CDS:2 [Gigaspora margarita]